MTPVTVRRGLSWAGIAVLVATALFIGNRPQAPSTPQARVEHIAASLRCPVCQGLSVADSDSETARSIRADIDQRIDDGQTDADIRRAYVDRFGEWILLRPAARGLGALVWAVPLVAGAVATAGLGIAGWRWRRRWTRSATDGDRQLVDQARAHHPPGHP